MFVLHPSSQHLLRTDARSIKAATASGNSATLSSVGVVYDIPYGHSHPKQRLDVYFPVLPESACPQHHTAFSTARIAALLAAGRETWGAWGNAQCCLARRPMCQTCLEPISLLPLSAEPTLPTVLVIHGGGWKFGSRRGLCGLHGNVGRSLASRGFVAAVVSYRTSVFRAREAALFYGLIALVCGAITAACLAGQVGKGPRSRARDAAPHAAALPGLSAGEVNRQQRRRHRRRRRRPAGDRPRITRLLGAHGGGWGRQSRAAGLLAASAASCAAP